MLVELTISDFAIIDHLKLELAPGFNVLTGETGAGKSIIIDALGTLLGQKTSAEAVRSGAAQARVEGVFAGSAAVGEPDGKALGPILREYGLETEGGTLILSREINRSGRSIGRVNGRAVPVNVLQQIGSLLVDIHGQSEHLSLLRVSEHLEYLDRFAGLEAERAQLAGLVTALRRTRRELHALIADERELARRVDLLRYQIDEIKAASLRPGEEEELERERTLLNNAERLTQLSGAGYEALYEGGERQRPVLDLLAEIQGYLAGLAKLDPRLQPQVGAVEETSYQLSEIARQLRAYRDGVEYNPARLEQVEERLDLLHNLRRKYGATLAEVAAFAARAERELETISHREERQAQLAGQEALLLTQIGELAGRLSAVRGQAARKLESSVGEELTQLSMPQACFQVVIRQEEGNENDGLRVNGIGDESSSISATGPNPLSPGRYYSFDSTGIDRVEFYISPNPGEPPKPLAKIASGGETSRLMLALRSVLSGVDRVPTLVFDEIDVGIGGRGGQVVGEKLFDLSDRHQVVCITHLPQIASFGDGHFSITKEIVSGRTVTRVRRVEGQERLEELALMLGAAGEHARRSAEELLNVALGWKQRRARG
ncbi:MAG: DNA repair protein RecN [Chloroflexi bacterium]|nr:DNA repair protein RecN [Chloroflexota bacterium]